jgi:hypothetical protein|tara:strand:- start:2328 stop:2669 length:342 start_codon:yes stop_codon:yes gene_type:complete
MARPKKQPHEKRTASTRADLTLAEKQHVVSQAELAGLSEAEFVRRCILSMEVQPAPRRIDASLVSELNAIGVNLNQKVRNENSGRSDHTGLDWSELYECLVNVLEKVAVSYGA